MPDIASMKTGPRLAVIAAFLGTVSAPAHAHGIPVWMFVAAISPVFVLILVVLYGWLARTLRRAFVHAVLFAIWVCWFWLASNHQEVTLLGLPTDYVIWTALALYSLHVLLLVSLVIVHLFRRWKARTQAK